MLKLWLTLISIKKIRMKSDRRTFLKNVSSLAVGATILPFYARANSNIPSERPKMRVLGRTGEMVSALGIGGHHIGDKKVTDDVAIQIMRSAIDRGVNFMDNAWFYKKGRSEELMGRALLDGYREKVLLMTKVKARTLDMAKEQFETSLKRFKFDKVDLLQFHAVGNAPNDVDLIYSNGLLEWMDDLRSQGLIKYIGFTGHKHPKPLMDMIKRGFVWDTIQMPLNISDYHQEVSFERDVLPLAIEKNIGVIGMKSNAFGRLASHGVATPVEGLRYAMSLPVSTVVSGIDSLDILEENLSLYENFKPYSNSEIVELLKRSEGKSHFLEHYRG